MQRLSLLSDMFLLHLPALPDRRQAGGDFVLVQRLRPAAQAVGQALRGGGFISNTLKTAPTDLDQVHPAGPRKPADLGPAG